MKRLGILLALLMVLTASNAMAYMYATVYDTTDGGKEYTFDLGLSPDGSYTPGSTYDLGITAADLGMSDWSTAVGAVYGYNFSSDGGFPTENTVTNYVVSWDGDGVANLTFSDTGDASDQTKLQNLDGNRPTVYTVTDKTNPNGYYYQMALQGTKPGAFVAVYNDNDGELALAADGSASGYLLSGTLNGSLDAFGINTTYSLIENELIAFSFLEDETDGTLVLRFDEAQGSTVPVPAAIWLLGSGLLGLMGLRKKYNR